MSELKAITVLNAYQLECDDNDLVYLKSDVDKVLAEKDRLIEELKSKAPQWVRMSDRLPTTSGPHLVIFQNGKGGCLPFNVEAKSFQVAGTVQLWADATDIFGDWTGDK